MTYLQNSVQYVGDHLRGEKSGRDVGKVSNIAQKGVNHLKLCNIIY